MQRSGCREKQKGLAGYARPFGFFLSIFRIPSSAGNHARYFGLEVLANQQMLLLISGGCLTNFGDGSRPA